jgi:hypothetical protein
LGFAASSEGEKGEGENADYYTSADKEGGDVVKE